MVDFPTVDTAKLGAGLAKFAKDRVKDATDSALETVTTIADGASSFGFSGLDSIVQKFKGLVSSFLSMIGLGSAEAPEAPAPSAPHVTNKDAHPAPPITHQNTVCNNSTKTPKPTALDGCYLTVSQTTRYFHLLC